VITAAIVMLLSVGFYGFKGGFFTIITGGGYRVWGPPATFLSGNNEVGLALLMTLPLLFFVRSILTSKLFAIASSVGIFLCFAAILGTQSRGAFIGILAMGMLLVWRSPNRSRFFMLLLLAIPFVLLFMPETWWERMESIKDYRSDPSAMGRINAWWMAYYLALDNPITGGGMRTFTRYAFLLYAPEPERVHDAHSIYFEVMGEQGFVGLLIFLLLGITALAKAGQIRRLTEALPELRWAYDLATMLQLSLLGYAVSGLFLGLAYFDYYYMLVGLIVGTGVVVQRHQQQNPLSAQAGKNAAAARPDFADGSPVKFPSPVRQATSRLVPTSTASPLRSYESWTFRRYVAFGKDWWARL
jgi:probable O-glycosylation ligase (exosortase A-associated)